MSGNITKSAIISYISIAVNILISFFYTPWMIHQIGVSDYGLYNLVLTFVSYFIMDFGLNSSVTRFIAKYRAEGNFKKIEQMLGMTIKVFIGIDFIIFLVLFTCYFFINNIFGGLTPSEIEKVKTLYVIASMFSVLTFAFKPIDGALNAFEQFVPNKTIDLAHRIGVVLLVIICLLCKGGVHALILVNCSVALVCSIIKAFVLKKNTGVNIDWHYNEKKYVFEVFSFSGWIFLQSLAMRFRLSFVPTILGMVSNSSQIAIFSLGMSLEGLIWMMSAALNGLFLPKVSRLVHDGDRSVLSQLMLRVGRIQLFIILLILSGFVVFGQAFIHLWVGDEFADVYYILLALTSSYIISNTTQIASDMVLSENKVKYTTRITFITSAIGLMGSLILAPRYGAIGCAVCSGLALIINQFFYIPFYKKQLGLDVVYFFKECHLKIIPTVAIIIGTCLLAVSKLNIDNWLSLVVIAGGYIITYSLAVYLLLFNTEEKVIIKNLIHLKSK